MGKAAGVLGSNAGVLGSNAGFLGSNPGVLGSSTVEVTTAGDVIGVKAAMAAVNRGILSINEHYFTLCESPDRYMNRAE